MLSALTKANLYLNFFGLTKIPLLWFCRPKIIHLDTESVEIKIPLTRRTKNHLNSMYLPINLFMGTISSPIGSSY